jgi:indole-3-glycerol phosphate synthase
MAPEIPSKSALERILRKRRDAVDYRKRVLPEAVLRMAVEKADPVRDFAGALTRNAFNIIAELKKASPSRGVLRSDFDAATLAAQFERAGAAALSVLTEEDFFQGDLNYLRQAHKRVALPILRKDFIVDPWQVWETRATNADSFLLIVAALSQETLVELLTLGRELGMEPLIEVHTREELDRAVEAGARILGVNNRDLRTLHVFTETSLKLIEAVPEECIAVAESGLNWHAQLAQLRAAGFDAFLIGESLMTASDPSAALRALVGEGA